MRILVRRIAHRPGGYRRAPLELALSAAALIPLTLISRPMGSTLRAGRWTIRQRSVPNASRAADRASVLLGSDIGVRSTPKSDFPAARTAVGLYGVVARCVQATEYASSGSVHAY